MKLRDVMADILVPFVADEFQLGAVRPPDDPVRVDAMNGDNRVVEKILQVVLGGSRSLLGLPCAAQRVSESLLDLVAARDLRDERLYGVRDARRIFDDATLGWQHMRVQIG